MKFIYGLVGIGVIIVAVVHRGYRVVTRPYWG